MIDQVRSRVPLFSFFTRLPAPVLVALTSFYLYLFTLAPDVLDSDGGEFQFAAWNFSFVHPTGYPLFLLFGGLFQHLFPIGNPAFRLNVFNAMLAALAVSVVYLAAREITHSRAAATITAVTFALSRTFWFNASGAEVYALNALFLALLIYLALRWRAAPSTRTFATFCLVYGLALTHHRTVALWIPAFAVFFFFVQSHNPEHASLRPVPSALRHPSRSRFALCAFSFLLPLALYLYIPLRAPASPYYQLPITSNSSLVLYDNSPNGFSNYVLGRTFEQELSWDASSLARLSFMPQLLLGEFGAIGVALGVVGLLTMLWRRKWALLALTTIGFAVTILFNAIYHIGDIAGYYIPVYLVWAMWTGMGVKNVRDLIRNSESRIRNYELVSLGLVIFSIPVFQLFTNYSYADRSLETRARSQWTAILSNPIPQNAILISNDRDEMMPLWYVQYVENTRRDLLGLFPLITPAPQYANVGRLTDSVLDSNRPIFFPKPLPGMQIKFRVEPSTSPLIRVLGRAAESAPQFSSNGVIANSVRVAGYDIARESQQLRVAIYFQAQSKMSRDYTTFVHLLSVHGGKAGQSNDHQVGGDSYPTSLWQIGETLRDEHVIPLDGVSPGTYRLFVGMYYFKNVASGEIEPFGDAEIGVIEIP